MRTFGFIVLAFVVGLVAGFTATVFGVFAWMEYAEVFDRDGGQAMGVFFTLGPLGGIVVGATAAIVTGARLHRRRLQVERGTRPPVQRWPLGVRAAVAAFSWGGCAWAVVSSFFWLRSPMSFESYEVALLVSWLPIAAPVLAALLGGGVVVWRRAASAI